ncbi:MAG TPA: ABC transporter substrate-binding protein [Polyangiaceae bacterium]|nr:ABC transporter substrate-binding protein [Polyangiaceae bacterium]
MFARLSPLRWVLWLVCVWAVASGCQRGEASANRASGSSEFERLSLRYQGFAGQVTYPELAEDLGYLAPIRLDYVGNTISGPQDIQTVVTRDIDFGGAFNGAVIKLMAAKAPITAVIGYYGVDDNTWQGYFVLDDSPIRSARDFIGKKVAMNTIGAHHEFVLREYLTRGGLTPDEIAQVTIVVVPPVSAEQALRQRQVDVAVLGSILRDKALERGQIRCVFSDHDLFGTFTAGSIVLTNDFLRDNPKTSRRFVEATARAIEWARNTPRDEVVARMQKLIERRGRNEDASATKYWRSTGVAGQGGLIQEREIQIWLDWLVKAGELKPNQLIPSALYTNELNPFNAGASQKGPA